MAFVKFLRCFTYIALWLPLLLLTRPPSDSTYAFSLPPLCSTSRRCTLHRSVGILISTKKVYTWIGHKTNNRQQLSRIDSIIQTTKDNQETTSPSPSSSSASSDEANDKLSPTELIIAREKLDPSTRVVVEAAAQKLSSGSSDGTDNMQKYPIDLPSPILLASCMISAIVSTGCLFELFSSIDSGNESSLELGFGPTILLALIGVPLSIFLLYAAITKATAETEADDQAFLSGK